MSHAMRGATWTGPRRIAHRGGGTCAPENTLAGIREAIARGYRAVEFDVMLTADDVPVLMHDPAFGRTIAGRGHVADTAYADLASRDAGAWFDPRFVGEPVPRYDDVVRFCRAHGIWMNVELKPSPGAESRTGRIVGEVTAALGAGVDDAAKAMLFSSFAVDALVAARAAAPDVPRALLVGGVARDTIDIARGLDCVGVHAQQRHLDADAIAGLHAAGFAVLAYTVNDSDRAAALDEAGIDAVFTDRIDLIPYG